MILEVSRTSWALSFRVTAHNQKMLTHGAGSPPGEEQSRYGRL
jgi:hypothetical protein